MPETPNKKLQKFLVNLIDKPHTLIELKTNSKMVISESPLSATHKKILLSSDVEMINSTISKALAGLKFFPTIKCSAQPEPMFIHIHGDKPLKLKGLEASKEFFCHIIFGPEHTQVKVSLIKKAAKTKIAMGAPQVMELIHILSDPGNP